MVSDGLMITANLDHTADYAGWRKQARALLCAEVEPAEVLWHIAGSSSDLFAGEVQIQPDNDLSLKQPYKPAQYTVPRDFLTLAEKVVCHRDEGRFSLLYRLLWRMTHGENGLLQRVTDDDVHTLTGFAKAVSRDRHKMTAFVRFRKSPYSEREHYSAWFEPSHHILRLTSDFFCKRFSNMDWSIFTPEGSAHWNQTTLVFGEAGTRQDIPDTEIMEQLWCTYFSNIFNPARLRLDAMQSEMPIKYWKNLPEAPIIARLTREAESRTRHMVDAMPTQEPRFAESALYRAEVTTTGADTIDQLRASVLHCDKCAHACDATQAVFGHGPETARIMVVGEQPGDSEDVQGKPFVGPSGKLIRSLLSTLSVDSDTIYFTNAVKHFKYTVRGKRRLHKTPSVSDIEHCRSWLMDEIWLIRPAVIIALGSTATRSLLGRNVSMSEERGRLQRLGEASSLMVTHHPARVLRAVNANDQRRFREELSADLAQAITAIVENGHSSPVEQVAN